jgi:hypothetical protein
MSAEKLEEMHTLVNTQMIPSIDQILKPDTDADKILKMKELRDFLIDEFRPDLSNITKSQAEAFVSRKKKDNAPAQRNVVLSDIGSYTQFKTDLSKKERELERLTGDVEKTRKKKRALLAKMGDNAVDVIFNAYLSVQADEATRLKRRFQSDTFGSQDSGRSLSDGSDCAPTPAPTPAPITEPIQAPAAARSFGWFAGASSSKRLRNDDEAEKLDH